MQVGAADRGRADLDNDRLALVSQVRHIVETHVTEPNQQRAFIVNLIQNYTDAAQICSKNTDPPDLADKY